MSRSVVRPVVGVLTVAVLGVVVALAATMFRGDFARTETITVLSPRAGLVMNPDARVQYRGVQIGKVSSIELLPGEQAAIHLAIDADRLDVIPANVNVNIASTTVFGAKFVQLSPPDQPTPDSVHPGQVLGADHVMVEVNTIFGQLVSVLSSIQPEKLNETLGAIATAMNGRGDQFGQTLSDLNSILGELNPSLSSLNHDLAVAPAVFGTYADVTPDLLDVVASGTAISRTIVERQRDLDSVLVSATGLAEIGDQVLDENRQPLADVLRLLVPTTDLTNEYNQALTCALGGMNIMANNPPLDVPGVQVLAGFLWGQERYRYPENVPKVAAKGGPFCTNLPKVPYQQIAPFVVTDVGANPWKYDNPGIVLNSDGLKQLLFGSIPGPPRNSAQIGMPG